MPLMIDNRIAEQALTMKDAIDAMESALSSSPRATPPTSRGPTCGLPPPP